MLVLRNISKLYDGSSSDSSSVHQNIDMYIDKGKIDKLIPHQPDASFGSEPTVIDCSDFTITPGMIDCHGHITILGFSTAEIDRMNSAPSLLYVEKILYTTLVNGGVTTMRDIGGATHQMKRLIDEGVMIGPRLKIAICMLSTTGGHADFRGPDRCHAQLSKLFIEGPGRPSSVVDGPWECRKRVREIAACGADLIKLCTSPGVASPSDKLEHQDFTADEIRAICDEAAARGLKVAAHAHSQSGIALAINNGVHDIQHISYMDERLVEAAFEKGCTVTPTSWIINALLKEDNLSDFVKEKVKKVGEVHAQAVQFAAKGGLKILAGTDAVLPGMHGQNYMEIASLIADGLSPLQAWHGATGLAAEEIGQTDTGELKPGKRADLLICKGNVFDKPELLGQGGLIEVIKDGEAYRGGIPQIKQRTFSTSVDQFCPVK
ncbi:MAG: amidohydrolase family protein [Candidatus Obscuribacterales bacterium]|jgi:imidazolonepropionase-like amidohydrolase|nr:amidohydrolase family protein [Candidatus Obscuribacterales bacterium]